GKQGHCISRLQRTGAVKRCAESSLANRQGSRRVPDNLIGITIAHYTTGQSMAVGERTPRDARGPSGRRALASAPRARLGQAFAGAAPGAPQVGSQPGAAVAELTSGLGDTARNALTDLHEVAADLLGRLDRAADRSHRRRAQLAANIFDGV